MFNICILFTISNFLIISTILITFLYPDKNVLDLYFQSIEYLIFINFLFNFYIKFYFVNVTPPQTYFAKKKCSQGGELP